MASDSADEKPIRNTADEFAYVYNQYYKTTVYAQGNIGNIRFYTDHKIQENKIAIYKNREEFVYDFDIEQSKKDGIDSYLGSLIKRMEEEYDALLVKDEDDSPKVKFGNANKIFTNPGAVRYEDLKDYIQKNKLNNG